MLQPLAPSRHHLTTPITLLEVTGKETFDCIVMAVDCHSGDISVIPSCKQGLTTKKGPAS